MIIINLVRKKKILSVFADLFGRFVYLAFYCLCIYVLFQNLNIRDEHSHLLALTLTTALAIYMLVKNKVGLISVFDKKYIIIAVIVIGCILRLLPILIGGDAFEWILTDNQGDTAIHYFGAQQLAFTGKLSDANAWYESVFPYLFSYTLLLSWFVKLFDSITSAILFSNLLFDAVAVFVLTRLLQYLGKKSTTAIILWWMNPLFIVMCWMPMSIVVVNMLTVISVCLGYLSYKSVLQKNGWMVAALFAFSVFVGNLFRPMFYVLLIAEIMMLGIVSIKRSNRKSILVPMLFMIVCAFLSSKTNNYFITNVQGYPIPENRGGWPIFVGANLTSNGVWTQADSYHLFSELIPSVGESAALKAVFEEGIQRYSNMTAMEFIHHMLSKIDVLYADIENASYDLKYAFLQGENQLSLVSFFAKVYYVLLLLGVVVCYRRIRGLDCESDEFFVILSFVGFTGAYLLVEVMNRYISMPLALMILILCISVPQKKDIDLSGEE